MKIELLPSGSYRIRKMYKGKTYTVITNHKPTQKEATILLAEAMEDIQDKGKPRTFECCALEYIEMKENVLSPSTVREYTRTLNWLSDPFRSMNIYDIDNIIIQKEINDFSSNHAPKTVHNLHGFISAVMKLHRPNLSINATLPQKVKNDDYMPSDEDVKTLLHESKGTMFEIPIRLACYGLRRSEICALGIPDLKNHCLTINKALVKDKTGKWVIKTTKTTESTRTVMIDSYLEGLIQEQGYIYKGFPNSISKYMARTEKRLGLKHFAIHKLRHFYATMLHDLGIPDSDIMKLGGWSSDHVMKKVYRHAVQSTINSAQSRAINYFNNLS